MDRSELIRRLQAVVGGAYVLHHPDDVSVYEQDALMVARGRPDVVVLPETAEQVVAVVRIAREAGTPVVARGAGTGLAGGAIAVRGGVVVALTRMTRILEVDTASRVAVVEPGVVNADLTAALEPYGLFYAPDPGSQVASTVGGNVANNSGGPHCLAYGVTSNNVLGLEVVLPDGTLTWVGGRAHDAPGYDLTGLLVGSEGTLGVVTKVVVRLVSKREAVRTLLAIYDTMDAACEATSAIIAAGMVPEALEVLDGISMRAVNATLGAGFPADAEAALLIEVEGVVEAVPVLIERIEQICRARGARRIQTAATAEERAGLWKGRKHAYGALGRLGRRAMMLDVCAPRSRLAQVMQQVLDAGRKWEVGVANFFHAGDGNMHPTPFFDFPEESPEYARVVGLTEDIMRACVDAGGTITGEHGIGLEKREYLGWMFGEADIAAMKRVKDVFDPQGLFNPDKIFPTGRPLHAAPAARGAAADEARVP
ncbi:MAG: FAD-linked oxidase C-terminal domain-containing protein [Armatimonadota bacterium]|nr:FAD-linked oxidase C-terminal domain-containing protein [Armatimonadota bacterium]MDR7533633.1 FAD-linked oxidase C-terminal domain-containing protein [Armatimonadota bacterium]MDR7537351.1 FAD-linked oxidase C-terminal domain-containing protein [Armatimonadota bacterium]